MFIGNQLGQTTTDEALQKQGSSSNQNDWTVLPMRRQILHGEIQVSYIYGEDNRLED
jgi:hypothetical protein